MNTIAVKVQYAVAREGIPESNLISHWVKVALRQGWPSLARGLSRQSPGKRLAAEVTVRIVGEKEMAGLNRRYRHKDGPTNVLSFGYDVLPGVDLPLLGDLVICAPLAIQEAVAQDKESTAHWAHLVVHGSLHLLGFDHEDSSSATLMEASETKILAQLGYPDPYYESHESVDATFSIPSTY